MMKRLSLFLFLLVAVGLVATPAWAIDLPPGFENPANNPTYQCWEPMPVGMPEEPPEPLPFDIPFPPTVWDNPFGPPTVTFRPTPETGDGEFVSEWTNGWTGEPIPTWHFDGDSTEIANIEIWIPNSPDPNPVKYLSMSIIADKSVGGAAHPNQIIPGPPGGNVSSVPGAAHSTQLSTGPGTGSDDGGVWYQYDSMYMIEPNPEWELIILPIIGCTNIASIEIATVCIPVPEPSTVVLLSVLGLALVGFYRTKK